MNNTRVKIDRRSIERYSHVVPTGNDSKKELDPISHKERGKIQRLQYSFLNTVPERKGNPRPSTDEYLPCFPFT